MGVECVSIVIPAYNAERWIARAIDSALGQDWPNTEVIVVNDGSTDETEGVCLSYGKRIRYCVQENRGVSAARNTGIEVATGAFIGFLDADDYLVSRMVSTLADALKLFPDAGAASGAYIAPLGGAERRCPPAGSVLGSGKRLGLVDDFFAAYGPLPLVWTGAVLVRRRALEQVGLFRQNLRLGEDVEMWTRIAGRFPWVFVDDVVAHYNLCPDSSVSFRPLRNVDFSFLYDEEEMQKRIKPELWRSYRTFRRDRTLEICRSRLRQGAIWDVRAGLRRIAPAPLTLSWAAMAVLSRVPVPLGRAMAITTIRVKEVLRMAQGGIRPGRSRTAC